MYKKRHKNVHIGKGITCTFYAILQHKMYSCITHVPLLWPIGSGLIDVVLVTTMLISQEEGDTPPRIGTAPVVTEVLTKNTILMAAI